MCVCVVTCWHQVYEQALCQQHLARTQNTPPTTVGGQRGAGQLREAPSVCQPQEGREGATETLFVP